MMPVLDEATGIDLSGLEPAAPLKDKETGIDLSGLEPKTPDLTFGRAAGRIGAETKRIASSALGSILGGVEAQESLREKRAIETLYEDMGRMPPGTAEIGQQYDEPIIPPLEPRPGATGQQYDVKRLLKRAIESKALQVSEKYEKSSGWFEDVIGQVPQFGAMLGASILNPALGMGFIGSQIMGGQYLSLREQGVKPERALVYSLVNAVVQGGLEGIGISKIMKAWKPQKSLIQRIRRIVEAGGTEWLTETVQAVPEAFTNLFALNPDKKMLTNLGDFLNELPEALKSGAYEGTVVLPLALLGAGAGQARTARTQTNRREIRKAEILIDRELKKARAQKEKVRQEELSNQQVLLKAARIKLGATLKKVEAEKKPEERRAEKEARVKKANLEHEEKIRRKRAEWQKAKVAEKKKPPQETPKSAELAPKTEKKIEAPLKEKKVAEAKEKRPVIPEFKSTNEALEFGKKATPEQMEELARLKKESNERFAEMKSKKAKSTDDLQAMSNEATKGQLYREAIEWKEVEKQGEVVKKAVVEEKKAVPLPKIEEAKDLGKKPSEEKIVTVEKTGVRANLNPDPRVRFSSEEALYHEDAPKGTVAQFLTKEKIESKHWGKTEQDGLTNGHWIIRKDFIPQNLKKRSEKHPSSSVRYDEFGVSPEKEIGEASTYSFGIKTKKNDYSIFKTKSGIIDAFDSEQIGYLTKNIPDFSLGLIEKSHFAIIMSGNKKAGLIASIEHGLNLEGLKDKTDKVGVKEKVAKEKFPEAVAEKGKPAAKPSRPYKKGDTITYQGKQFKVLKVDPGKDILKLKGKYTTFQTSIKKAVEKGYEIKEKKAEPQLALESTILPKKKAVARTPVADINKAINPITNKWKKVAGITPHVKVAQDISELPLRYQDKIGRQVKEGKRVKGFYDSKENTVFLLGNNLKSVDEALQTLAHETFNHAGLEKIVGKKFYDQVWKSFIAKDKAIFGSGKDVSATNLYKIAKDYDYDLNTAEGRRNAVKEKLGRMAEINDKTPLMRRVLRSIQVWLRKMGFNFKVTDEELMGWLAKGKRAVETGKIKKAGEKVGVEYAIAGEKGEKAPKPLSKKEKKELNHLKTLAHRLAPGKKDLDAAKIEALGKIKSMASMDVKEARAVVDALKKKGREVQTIYEEVIEGISKREERKETKKAIKDWEEAGEAIAGKDIKEIYKLAESKNLTKADVDAIVRTSTKEATGIEELNKDEADILKLLIMDREKVILHGVESFREIDKSAAISKKTKEKLERAIRIYDVDDLDLVDYALQYQKGKHLVESEAKDIVEYIKIVNEMRPEEKVLFPYFTPVKRILGEKFVAPFRHMSLKVQESSHPLYEKSKKIFKGLGSASRRRITEFREGRLAGEKLSNEEKRASNEMSKIYDSLWEVFEMEAYIEKYNPRRPSFKNKTQLVNWVFSPQGTVNFDFWAEKVRTGQLSKTEKDSLRLLQSYITVGYRHKYGEEAIEKIQPLLDSFNEQKKTFAQSWINTVIKKHPTKDEKVGDLAISRLMRGIEAANEKTVQKIFKKAEISVSQNPRLYRTFVHELQSANYSSFMGLRPKLGIRNSFQQWLIVNEYGLSSYLKGRTAGRMNQEVKIAMELSDLVQIRKKQYQVWEEKLSGITDIGDKARDAMMVFYRAADIDNVKTAFATGYMAAKKRNPNASDKDLIRAGEKAVANTQWGYGIDLPVFFKSPTGKLMGQYSSWAMWYFDHMHRTIKERKGGKAARTAAQFAILAFVAQKFDYDYLKTVLLGVIPTGIGVIPSKIIGLAKFLQAVGVGDKRNIRRHGKEALSSLLLFAPGYLAHKDVQKAMDEGIEHLFFYKKNRKRKEVY